MDPRYAEELESYKGRPRLRKSVTVPPALLREIEVLSGLEGDKGIGNLVIEGLLRVKEDRERHLEYLRQIEPHLPSGRTMADVADKIRPSASQ